MEKLYTEVIKNTCNGCPNCQPNSAITNLVCTISTYQRVGWFEEDIPIPEWCPLPEYNKDEIKYFKNTREDFEKRFIRAKIEFNRHLNTNYSKALVEKMLLLYDACSLTFFGFFEKVIGDFSTLEGLENFNSMVGNFYDDSYFVITYDQDKMDQIKNHHKLMRSLFPDEGQWSDAPEDNIDCYRIEWSFSDGEDAVSEEKLFAILDRLLDRAKEIKELITDATREFGEP